MHYLCQALLAWSACGILSLFASLKFYQPAINAYLIDETAVMTFRSALFNEAAIRCKSKHARFTVAFFTPLIAMPCALVRSSGAARQSPQGQVAASPAVISVLRSSW